MFYELKKGGQLVERMNPTADKAGKTKPVNETDADAVVRAKEVGADEVVTSIGRKVL